ncbi:CHAT domain-containing protein [Nostoc sp. FACHB-110]|nr:CHAT domain-containing protein [Nostoc sp. FACHB-110]
MQNKFKGFFQIVQSKIEQLQARFIRRFSLFLFVGLFFLSATLPSTAHKIVLKKLPSDLPYARNLVQQGKVLYEAEKFNDAVKVLQQAAEVYAASGDRLRQAMTLRNLSLAYQKIGLWKEAQEAISVSRQLLKNVENSPQSLQILAQTLDVQAQWQLARGQAQSALQTWQQAADIYRQIKEHEQFIRMKINTAQAWQVLGMYSQAKKILTEIELNLQYQQNSSLKATGLRRLGNILRLVGDLNESKRVLNSSLEIASSLHLNEEIAEALMGLANTTRDLGDTQATLNFYKQAATVHTSINTRIQLLLNQFSFLVEIKNWSDANTLIPLIQLEINKLPASRIAVYAQINFAQNLAKLKQKANVDSPSWLDIAEILATSVKQAQSLADKQAESYAQGTLGWLYEQTGQLIEAKELTEKALFIAHNIEALDIAYQWQWQLGRLGKIQGDKKNAISYYSQAVKTLQSLRNDLAAINPTVQFSFRENVEPVYRELVELLLQKDNNLSFLEPDNLKQAQFVIESLQVAELDNFFRQACSIAKVEIDKAIEQDPTAAVVYPIILPNRLDVILKLPGQKSFKHYSTNISQQEVESTLEQLRASIVIPQQGLKTQSLSMRVYDWLIRPFEEILEKNQVKTLVFVLDGSLRNVPMASLYNGKQYLLEKYAIALTPSLQLFDPKPLTRKRMQVLTAGLSEARLGFAALPNVERELQEIKSQVGAKVMLNKNFTSSAFQRQIESIPFKVVHLATHGQFSSNTDKTFILSWDKQIKINELSNFLRIREGKIPQAVELLVLSACQTAAGDNRATLGLAGIAVQAGARSTLASLWSVEDESTSILMSQFYKKLTQTPQITKAEALRQAQLTLLKNPTYQHPLYWVPYVLVGNWL